MKKTKLIGTVSVFLAMVFAVSAVFVSAALFGDVTHDNKINSQDARVVLRHAAKLELLSEDDLKQADLDGSGKVNSADARIMLRIAAKLDKIEDYTQNQPTEPPTTTEAPTTPPTTVPPTTAAPTTTQPPVVFGPENGDVPTLDIGALS